MMASEIRDYLTRFIEINGDRPAGVLLALPDAPAQCHAVVQVGRITLPELNGVAVAFICGSKFDVLVVPAMDKDPATGKG